MKERSTPLSDQEVRGFLAGELSKLCRPIRFPKGFDVDRFGPKGDVECIAGKVWRVLGSPAAPNIRCPFGVPGDQLWVKEASRWSASLDGNDCEVEYRADGAKLRRTQVDESGYSSFRNPKFWTPSAQMPLWASRLYLRVLTVEAKQEDGEWWWVGTFERVGGGAS